MTKWYVALTAIENGDPRPLGKLLKAGASPPTLVGKTLGRMMDPDAKNYRGLRLVVERGRWSDDETRKTRVKDAAAYTALVRPTWSIADVKKKASSTRSCSAVRRTS